MEALYRLKASSAEVLQFKVQENAQAAGKPIRLLPIKRDTLIAAIVRGQKLLIPTGDDEMMADDHVLVVTPGGEFDDLDDILE